MAFATSVPITAAASTHNAVGCTGNISAARPLTTPLIIHYNHRTTHPASAESVSMVRVAQEWTAVRAGGHFSSEIRYSDCTMAR
jgi:hypothetical protein